MGGSPRIAALVAAGFVALAAASPARAAFHCPAPVPVVGDVRRLQVDELFFAVMARAEAEARMPLQADVDAVLADTGLLAEAQSPGYTRLNALLYTLAPGGGAGFRVGLYTAETWGYTIEQDALDAAPVVTDNEATYRPTGGGLGAIDDARFVARGWRIAGPGGRYPTAATLVRDALARGVNEGRVAVLATADALPRTGWVGIFSAGGDQLAITGRTCSKAVTELDEGGVERLVIQRRAGRPAVCPANATVAQADRRDARGLFDAALAHALAAHRAGPDAGDVAAAIAATSLAAVDVSATARDALPADGLVYELGAGRFAVARRSPGGAVFRIGWYGLDLPIVVRAENERRLDASAAFAWRVDRVARLIHRHRDGRFASAGALVRALAPTAGVPLRRVRSWRSVPATGTAGIWVSPDRRTALVRGRVCRPVALAYAKT